MRGIRAFNSLLLCMTIKVTRTSRGAPRPAVGLAASYTEGAVIRWNHQDVLSRCRPGQWVEVRGAETAIACRWLLAVGLVEASALRVECVAQDGAVAVTAPHGRVYIPGRIARFVRVTSVCQGAALAG